MRKKNSSFLQGLIALLLAMSFTSLARSQDKPSSTTWWEITQVSVNDDGRSDVRVNVYLRKLPSEGRTIRLNKTQMEYLLESFKVSSAHDLIGARFTAGDPLATLDELVARKEDNTVRVRPGDPEPTVRRRVAEALATNRCPKLDDFGPEQVRRVHSDIMDPSVPWLTTLIREVRQATGGQVRVHPIPFYELRQGGPINVRATVYDDGMGNKALIQITIDPNKGFSCTTTK